MENACLVVMKCVTNMHVGNGDVNYNIIDNEIERDPITGYPTINASGVKGALRAYFTKNHKELVNSLFGDEKDRVKGGLKILSAEMIAMPQRATLGDKAYYLITTKAAVERINELAKIILGKSQMITGGGKVEGAKEAEGRKIDGQYKMGSTDLYTIQATEAEDIFTIPVYARNCLENGVSINLWYEEAVPHETILCFGVIADTKQQLEDFVKVVDGEVIQFGGNATIGYGLCQLSVMK